MKILLVEDSRDIKLLVEAALGGFTLEYAEDLEAAFVKFQSSKYDLILLDLVLPDGSGFSFYEKIKLVQKHKSETPVIFLTLKNDSDIKVKAFGLGAADFVTKPFDPRELRARVMARAMQSTGTGITEKTEIKYGNVLLKINDHTVICTKLGKKTKYKLTPTEFRLLYLLFRNGSEIMNREEIMKELWNDKPDVNLRIIDKYMNSLRKKLNSDILKIESVHGSGYRLTQQVADE